MSRESTSLPDWVTLTGDERVVWSGRPSLYPIVTSILVGVLIAVFGLALYWALPNDLQYRWLAYLLVPGGLLVTGIAYVRHRSTYFVVTNNEVYKKTGIFSREVTSLRVDRIQNTTFTQSLGQRLLSYGDVHIDTAGSGGTEIVFESVEDPQEVSSLLSEQLDRTTLRPA
jgi:uncharacterized membrane protein YdbT with pleckstrin-like domain